MLNSDGSIQVEQVTLVSLQGEVESLLDNQKPNLVYFFAPWCDICRLSIANLNYLDQNKINTVIVALDYQNTQEVAQFIQDTGVKARVYLGTNDLKSTFNIKGYPSYYLIAPDFSVVGKSYGYSTALGLKLRETFGFSANLE